MSEKFVRDCDNVTDIKKVDFVMARQSDLIHTTDGKEWVMNNGVPEQISGAVVSMETAENDNHDVQISFNSNNNGTPSNVGNIIMSGEGFGYNNEKSMIINKGVLSVSSIPSSTVGEVSDGVVFFDAFDKTIGQINFKSPDFVTITHDTGVTNSIDVSISDKDSDWIDLTLFNSFSKADPTSRARVRTRNNQEYLEVDLYNIKFPAVAGNIYLTLALLPDTIENVLNTDYVTAIDLSILTHISVRENGADNEKKPHIGIKPISNVAAGQLFSINFTVPMK